LKSVVIGVGNVWRGDDGVGPAVAKAVARLAPGIAVREVRGEAIDLWDAWEGFPSAVVVDAVSSGAAPGTIHRWDLSADDPAPLAPPVSTHGLGLFESIRLARMVGRFPQRIVVFAVEGRGFDPRGALSRPVARAVDETAARVIAEIQARDHETGSGQMATGG
jgi:hydrogenase maturation protease